MAYLGPIRRWDTFWADLEPGVGHKQRGESRPVVVVSNDGFNAAPFRMVTVLPATRPEGKGRKAYTFEVVLPKGIITQEHGSIVMPQQVRSISTLRLLDKIGSITDPVLQAEIENRLLEHLGVTFVEDDAR